MKIIETPIRDLFLVEPSVFRDARGYFFESFNSANAKAAGLNYDFVQDNQSHSIRGTLRGLHFQTSTMSQAKLVSVAYGSVLDVAVDLREESPTYGKSYLVEINDQNFRQLMIPRGFAHGFVCLSETAIFTYKCDNYYSKVHESGIRFDDPDLNIEWPMPRDEMIVSEKDLMLPLLKQIKDTLCF